MIVSFVFVNLFWKSKFAASIIYLSYSTSEKRSLSLSMILGMRTEGLSSYIRFISVYRLSVIESWGLPPPLAYLIKRSISTCPNIASLSSSRYSIWLIFIVNWSPVGLYFPRLSSLSRAEAGSTQLGLALLIPAELISKTDPKLALTRPPPCEDKGCWPKCGEGGFLAAGISSVWIKVWLVLVSSTSSSSKIMLHESLVLLFFVERTAKSFGSIRRQTTCSRRAATTYLKMPEPGSVSRNETYF